MPIRCGGSWKRRPSTWDEAQRGAVVELGQENGLPREEEACVAGNTRGWKPGGARQQQALGAALPGVLRGHLLPVKVVEDRPRQLFQMIGVNLWAGPGAAWGVPLWF